MHDSRRSSAAKASGWRDGRQKKKRPHKAAVLQAHYAEGLVPLRRILGFVRGVLGGIGGVRGGALHRVGPTGSGGAGSGWCRRGGGGSLGRSRGSGRRSSLLSGVGSLLSGVGRLLGVLRGILRAVAACRQQRDERGGE